MNKLRLHLEELEPRCTPSPLHGAAAAHGHHKAAIVSTVKADAVPSPALTYQQVEDLIASLPPVPPLDTVAAINQVAAVSIVNGQVVQDSSQWSQYYIPFNQLIPANPLLPV